MNACRIQVISNKVTEFRCEASNEPHCDYRESRISSQPCIWRVGNMGPRCEKLKAISVALEELKQSIGDMAELAKKWA